MDDFELLREYVDRQSEAAFAELMRRHAGLVYSAAIRQVRDPHLAQEVTQVTFIILAKKAQTLRRGTILSGWLYRTTRFVAFDAVKAHMRRQQREYEAAQMETAPTDDFQWKQIEPILDEAVSGLGEKDRNAVLLRFFENKSLFEVGAALGTNEEAARKQISRAVEKLRVFFAKRGVTVPAVALVGLLFSNAVQAAPLELLSPVAVTTALKGISASGTTSALLKTTLKLMTWTKIKTGIVVGAVMLFATGATVVTVKEVSAPAAYSWEHSYNGETSDIIFAKTPPQVRIVPSIYSRNTQKLGIGTSFISPPDPDNKYNSMGICVPVENMISIAYLSTPTRTVFLADIPKDRYYDFFCNLPPQPVEAIREEIKKKFGLAIKKEMRETDVLVLKIANSDLPGLKPANSLKSAIAPTEPNYGGRRSFAWIDASPARCLPPILEDQLSLPVIDETGITTRYDFTFIETDTSLDSIQMALQKLGLKLVPAKRTIEMLVVTKADE